MLPTNNRVPPALPPHGLMNEPRTRRATAASYLEEGLRGSAGEQDLERKYSLDTDGIQRLILASLDLTELMTIVDIA